MCLTTHCEPSPFVGQQGVLICRNIKTVNAIKRLHTWMDNCGAIPTVLSSKIAAVCCFGRKPVCLCSESAHA